MKLETLNDLLDIDTDKNKADDNKRLLRKVKQLLKSENKAEKQLEASADDMPYEAVSVVGKKLVTIKFDLESKKGVVVSEEEDSRDTNIRNPMASYFAGQKLKKISKEQRPNND